VHCIKWFQYSGGLWLWGEQRTVGHCQSTAREQWAEAPNMGETRGPRHAPCPEGPGHNQCQLFPAPPRPGHLEFMQQFPCSLPFNSGDLGQVTIPQLFDGDSVGRHKHSANAVGPFPLHVFHGPYWKGNATL
jgi:hypothetical protein